MASTVSLKSQPLHNFSLPHLKWAKNHTNTHRFRKLADSTQKSPPYDSSFRFINDSDSDTKRNNSVSEGPNYEPDNPEMKSSLEVPGFVEKKSMASDGKTKIVLRYRSKNKIDDVVTDTGDKTSIAAAAAADFEELESKTWNLRPRKLIIKGASKSKEPSPQVIKTQPTQTTEKIAAKEAEEEEKKKKKKQRRFSIALSKEEIELDILAMTGSKPTRRPKKRPKYVQRQLDSVFPGLWLDSITPDSYKVSDNL